ncbi:DNA-directed RNA polymerase III C1 subunit, putative [Theileria equi strain WA]|uniref:DNA-directed RNA polymerase subunit n=1 Tax=Theileria equi strain WA TaxID=1537102 RepID=L0B0B3_THEEQ|nr:DNA-directed RNA polymerase III C1 subunit, putative [Theileria equi strain WA]AFZ81260.1 DNA-directed RNA polymerase III C1 subunit, putative [Theileria equi strain WA]|eukprot:XP_004830926.1 DNA-directed RNA polymerase III C1 subunit, putative [Theileria equi strain WA]
MTLAKRQRTGQSSEHRVKREINPEANNQASISNNSESFGKNEDALSNYRVKRSDSFKEEARGGSSSSESDRFIVLSSAKELVPYTSTHCTIEGVQFDVMGSSDIERAAILELQHRELYLIQNNEPQPLGALDKRLGCSRNEMTCSTCGKDNNHCVGHWGYVKLELPVFHVGFFKYLNQILYCICKRCSNLLLPEDSIKKYQEIRNKGIDDPLFKVSLFRKILQECKNKKTCDRCGAPQGTVKRIVKPTLDQFMRMKHVVRHKESGKVQARDEELNPIVVKHLFEAMDPAHVKLLNIASPEKMIITNLAISPNCIRPSVPMEGQGSTEDDLTIITSDIIEVNKTLKKQLQDGQQSSRFILNWQFMQLHCTRLINTDAPAVSQLLSTKNITKPGRGLCQRLKGKEGRFRGNLSGKRADFSSRTVISPDPNVGIDEIVVPEQIATKLTFPEVVNAGNIEVLRKAVINGWSVWPGASYVIKANGSKTTLRIANPNHIADNLEIGDIVERHLWDGDIVIFNRQPSLHRMSIMAHRVRVMPGSTFRFNECVCQPYNADFDGDEMNMHLPQTYEARAESLYLLSVLQNLTTPRNGDPLIAAVQDFLSASYLLTSKDRFLTRKQFCQICCYFTNASIQVDIPPPAIIYPTMLWTGKQIFNVLLRPSRKSNVIVNFECREREFHNIKDYEHNYGMTNLHQCMCPKDGYVIFYNSELMCGALGVKSLGASKGGLFYQLLKKNSSKIAAECMLRVSKLASRWLAEFGMTIGLDDVRPGAELLNRKSELLMDGYSRVSEAIKNFKDLQAYPGCTREETLELQVKSVLDDLRNEAGKVCNAHLKNDNKPLIMFNSGAKGALINIAQMVACVGQQNVSGQRIQNGFIGRTLPHFNIGCRDAKSRGFVANSFFSGLEPEEFFFHTMSGREGLIDTAVKTSETGYMQRKLMKVMEDLAICYDHTVRASDGHVVQFLYGDDGLSASLNMSDKNLLENVLQHIRCITRIPKLVANDSGSFQILPPQDLSAILKRVDLAVYDQSLVSRMPSQLKNKVKTFKEWVKPKQKMMPVDEDLCQQLRNNIAAFIAVYEDVSYVRRNLPLFPFEIVQWSNFLQPLLLELLPRSIHYHINVSYSEKATHQKGTESKFSYSEIIDATLNKWAVSVDAHLDCVPFQDLCTEFEGSGCTGSQFRAKRISKHLWISLEQIFQFIRYCWKDYQKGVCEPGEAIGALGAQSIGEPATQMTLKTFHFAGVASMNVTLGVPRIQEIINASASIITPIIEVPLVNKHDYDYALSVKARIEKTTLGQICSDIRELFTPNGIRLIIKLNANVIQDLFLQVDAYRVRDKILEQGSIKKIKINKQDVHTLDKWQLYLDLPATETQLFQQHALINGLLDLVVAGGKRIKRAIIKRENTASGCQYQIAVEGYGLQEVMGAYGVQSNAVKTNHIYEVAQVLGIEAARSTIISEIQKCMDAYSIDIDGRYMKLLGDIMTSRGEVIGINRHGIKKRRTSALMLASFEETNEHLFEAAVHSRKDPVKGVSECIIVGKQMPLGTGSFDLLLKSN